MKNKFENVREQYKYLRENKDIVFLNSSATSLKPDVFVEKLAKVYSNNETTYGKSHLTSENDKIEQFELTIKKVANHINANEDNVIPTYGTTDFINKVAHSLISKLEDGDEIILGKLEHAANILPWTMMIKEQKKDITVKWYELKDWVIDYDKLAKLVTNKTKLISVAHIFNTTSAKNDLEKIRLAVGNDVTIIVDGAQAIGHTKIDVTKGDIDYYIFGTHKAFGPHSLGFAYVKNLENIESPWTYGGGSNITYDEDSVVWKENKDKFISGTRDVPGIIAFGTSIDYIESFGVEDIERYNNELKDYAEEKIGSLDNVRIINKGVKGSNLFFEVKGVAGEDVGYHLGLRNIVVRTGTNCVKMTYGDYETYKSIRVSFHIYNTKDDVNRLYEEIKSGGDFLDSLFNKKPTSKICT